MKWVGALLFIAMTTWIGLDYSQQFTKRPKHIRQVKNALQILEAEILYSQSPLIEAFATIEQQVPDPMQSFFHSLVHKMQTHVFDLSEVWDVSVDELIKESCLKANEAEILKQFGKTLGQHDFSQQQKHIQLSIHHLERELEEARDEHYQYSKLSKSLGFLSGVFIVLLLI